MIDSLPHLEGFVRIEGYSKYAICRNGEVYSFVTNRLLCGSTNPAGYVNVRIKGDDGVVLTWGLHRLLAYAFIKCLGDYRNMYVNHIDGNKSNNRLENLEWVTPGENVRHAGLHGLTAKCLPIQVFVAGTGKVSFFSSIADAALQYGMSKDAIRWRLGFGPSRLFQEGRAYRLAENTDTWPAFVAFEGKQETPILMKCLKTHRVIYFPSQRTAAEALKVSEATISQWLLRQDQPVLPGLMQIQKDTFSQSWRKVTDPYFEVEDFTKRRVIRVTRESTGEVFLYESAVECCEAHALSPTLLLYWLKKGTRAKTGLVFEYYRDFIGKKD